MILLTLFSPLVMLPLVGLGIDGARGYIVQSKLSAAVDGAGLGAGRLIGTNANTTEIAGEFLKTNFPAGYWGTGNYDGNGSTTFNPNITYTRTNGTDQITVNAKVDLPTTFIRLIGMNKVTVGASAVVTRTVTRVILVLDRSGSMTHIDPTTGNSAFSAMQTGAEWFASHFTPNYDELGLVVFTGSSIVAYPTTRPWSNSPTGAGGPDKSFATDAQNQVGPIFDSLRAMTAGGGTGTPEALEQAYIEMQKAHNRDLAANGNDNVMNNIVLFTDGVPDAVAVYANDPNGSSVSMSASTCTNKTANVSLASTQMKGYIVAPGGPPNPWGTSWGLLDLFAFDNSQTLNYWLANGSSNFSVMSPNSAVSSCGKLGWPSVQAGQDCNQNQAGCGLNDLTKFPSPDLYGTATTGSNYQHSLIDTGTSTYSPNTTSANFSSPTSGYSLAAAAWNATDNIAFTIRANNTMNPIKIITIGYSGNGGVDSGLLYSVANDNSTGGAYNYQSSQAVGKYYKVNNSAQLQDAFNQVASSLMRLSQ
jgi:hypothetical protein